MIDSEDLVATYTNLDVGFAEVEAYDSAFFYYSKAYDLSTGKLDKGSIILTLANVASTAFRMGNLDTALVLSKRVLDLSSDYFTLLQVVLAPEH